MRQRNKITKKMEEKKTTTTTAKGGEKRDAERKKKATKDSTRGYASVVAFGMLFLLGLVVQKMWRESSARHVRPDGPTFEWETSRSSFSIYADDGSDVDDGTLKRNACPIDGNAETRKVGEESRRIASSRVPFVFSAMDCFDWWYPKMEKQDIDQITDIHMGRHRLRQVRVGGEPTFRLRNVPRRPWLRHPDVPLLTDAVQTSETAYELRNTTLDTFFDMPKRWVMADGSRERGYAQCSNSIEGTEIEAEITATGLAVLEFALDETTKASRFGLEHKTGSKTVLWLNTKGSSSATHFDRTHNFVLQLDGKKRWTLYPPESWPQLAFQPYMHVGYDTSRRGVEEEEKKERSEDNRVRSYQIETVQGDVLYIPPFWSTKVETLKNSAHLSINSPSLEQMMLARAYWRINPFLDGWSVSQRVAAFWGLMDELCDALDVLRGRRDGGGLPRSVDAKDFLRVGLGSRYERLVEERRSTDESSRRGLQDVERDATFRCDDVDVEPSEALLREYRVLAAEVANDLAEIKRSVVHIFLLDLAEELIMSVMSAESDPSVVVDFVALCLV